MITPNEIATKAGNAYKKFLGVWVRGEEDGFFPMRMPANLRIDKKDVASTIRAVTGLREKSKERRGWGYTIHWQQVTFRDIGSNPRPERITIDTLDDLLRLAGGKDHFEATRDLVRQLRAALPGLSDWIVANVQSLAKFAESSQGLIAVTQYFIDNPWPDCYARQFPVHVDTKFVERHQAVLRQWLDILLPPSAINVNETKFSYRFGLRDSLQHRAVRILDDALTRELGLPFGELSLPLRSLAVLPVRDAIVIIVENRLNLLTLPCLPRAIGIEGEGKAVTRLEKLNWLHDNRIIYWGDIDVDGFQILSSLRGLFPHTESKMMDTVTLELHQDHVVEGNGQKVAVRSNLTKDELVVYQQCQQQNLRLEQERILQKHVDSVLQGVDRLTE